MLVCEKFTSSFTRLRGFHLGRVLPHEDNHHTNEREGLLAKSETSRPWRKLRRARGAVWEHPSYWGCALRRVQRSCATERYVYRAFQQAAGTKPAK